MQQMSSSAAENTTQEDVQLQQAPKVQVHGKERQQIVAKTQQDTGMWSNNTIQRSAPPTQPFEHNRDGKGANRDTHNNVNTAPTLSQSDQEWKDRLKSLDMNFSGDAEHEKPGPQLDVQKGPDLTFQTQTGPRESLGLLLHDAFDKRQPIVKFVTPSSPADRAGIK